jgi:hypothetical protein
MIHTAPTAFEAAHFARANRRQEHIERLENGITELSAHIYAATYRLLELIREYDECEGWAQPGLRSCAHWLNWKCGISIGAAREKVRVANALKNLTKISDAFREGRISYSKVRAMTRVATPENEDYLMMIARHGTATHVDRLVRLYRRVKRTEALEQENHRHEIRELTLYPDDDGSFVVHGRLTAEQGALVKKALEAVMDEDFSERKNAPAETPDDEIYPRPQWCASHRADALVRISEAYLSDKAKESNSGDRYLVHVHTDVETLKSDGTGAEAELEDCGHICAESSRRLSCDAGVVHWLENSDGEPLSVGRKTRSISPAIRRALKHRDGGCRFPGCTCTRFVDAHHIRHWADGGVTSMDNLTLLCRHHHRLVHEGGFGVEMDVGGQMRFTKPDGQVMPDNGETHPRGNVIALRTAHADSGIHITAETTITKWCGERMDDQMAVEGLIYNE